MEIKYWGQPVIMFNFYGIESIMYINEKSIYLRMGHRRIDICGSRLSVNVVKFLLIKSISENAQVIKACLDKEYIDYHQEDKENSLVNLVCYITNCQTILL